MICSSDRKRHCGKENRFGGSTHALPLPSSHVAPHVKRHKCPFSFFDDAAPATTIATGNTATIVTYLMNSLLLPSLQKSTAKFNGAAYLRVVVWGSVELLY